MASAAVHVPQVIGHRPVKGSVISRSGVCRAFDAKSDGTVSGNGAAAVVLRRLDRAQRSGDRVHATILSVSVNNDGAAKQAYAAPSADGQAAVIARAVDLAGVSTADIGYVEAHGTGTYKGDPIEFSAMDRVWRARDWTPGGCALGAVKPSIGHLDSAAGLPGLIKAIGVLRRGVIPPLPNFTAPNPSLPLDDGPFRLPAAAQQWPESDQPRRAGVTALGVGGTNAHAILEEAPPPRGRSRSRRARVPGVLPLSAADPGALRQLAADWAEYLRDHPDVELADVVTTAALGRRRMRRRLAVLGTDPDALRDGLEAYAASKESPRCLTGTVDRAAPGTAAPGSRPEYRAGHNGAVASTSQERDQRLAEAHCSGDSIEWEQVLAGFRGRRIPLPTYPFQRKPHWIGPAPRPEPAPQRSAPSSHHSPGNRGETMTTSERVLDHIQQVAAAQLGCEPADVAAGVAFTVLGADSLSLVNLANDLEKNFGVRVSMRELFEVGDTPDKLAKLVADRIDEAPPA
ncbi:MAG: ketoacyl-synthetase C-terminal extension domain-containing protein, partial [Micromonosporaceae bacterium]